MKKTRQILDGIEMAFEKIVNRIRGIQFNLQFDEPRL